MSVPFTFQTIPKSIKKYKFGNDFVAMTLYLELRADFEEACSSVSKMTQRFKKSIIPGGGYTLLQFYTTFMPYSWMNMVYHTSGAKHTLLLSNVPGYMKPVHYGGKPAKRFFSLISGSGNLATSISIVSMPESA